MKLTRPTGQGQVWRVHGRRPRTAVILDTGAIIARRDMIVCTYVRDPDELPENLALLAVPITSPVVGVVALSDITHYLVEHYTEYLGDVEAETMARVKAALRARFDL